jgi:hypothetical protein
MKIRYLTCGEVQAPQDAFADTEKQVGSETLVKVWAKGRVAPELTNAVKKDGRRCSLEKTGEHLYLGVHAIACDAHFFLAGPTQELAPVDRMEPARTLQP